MAGMFGAAMDTSYESITSTNVHLMRKLIKMEERLEALGKVVDEIDQRSRRMEQVQQQLLQLQQSTVPMSQQAAAKQQMLTPGAMQGAAGRR